MSKYNITAPTATPKTQIPAGTHVARIYKILDLGTQPSFDGKKPPMRVLSFYFETPTKKAVFNPDLGEQPFTLNKDITFLLSKENAENISNLSKLYKAVNGTTGLDQNIFDLIGKVLMITTDINQKGYANITGFAPVSDEIDIKDKKFAPINSPVELFLDANVYGVQEHNLIENLPDFIKNKIKASPEYVKCEQAFDASVGISKEPDSDIEIGELENLMPF